MNGFKVEAILTRCSSLADGGLTVGLHTKELPPDEKIEVMKHHGKADWLVFKENDIADEDIPKQDAEYEVKTPSQRLRAVTFILWQQSGSSVDFEQFYRETMEKFINHIKQKLE